MPAAPPTHDQSARLDFFEGARSFVYREIVSPLLAEYPARAAAAGVAPVTKEEAGQLYTADPRYLFACGIQRTAQRLTWATAAESVHRDSASLESELAASSSAEPGGLELDPELELPHWYTQFDREGRDDIHLVPGGYWRDPLVGAVYDRGGAAYRLAWRSGYDARPGALHAFVQNASQQQAGATSTASPQRVLDLGCAFGGLTRVIRAVLPGAEVTGIDLSAPALRYAHHLAVKGGQEITYAQRDAERTGYPDGSFDLVTAFLLLHEVPDDVRASIMRESFRILAPGGWVAFLDIPPYSALDPARAWFESFDGRGNGENHWESFLDSDFPGLLGEVGFTEITQGPLDFDDPGYWGSSALAGRIVRSGPPMGHDRSEAMSATTSAGPDAVARGDRVTDGVYRALPDEVSDRLLSLVTALAAEVWTTRDRLRLVEAALAPAGVDLDIDAVRNTPEQLDVLRVDRDAFVERVYGLLAVR